MKYRKILSRLALLICATGSTNIQANLIDRGNGMIYDQDLDVTWLQDANLAENAMSWEDANQWASNLVIGIYSDWRLPSTLEISGVLPGNSEIGHLFITELGGTPGTQISYLHNSDYDLFSNIMIGRYWTGTDRNADGDFAWGFTTAGIQNYYDKADKYYAWAVRDGDVAAVPIPGMAGLFGYSLVAFLVANRRKTTA